MSVCVCACVHSARGYVCLCVYALCVCERVSRVGEGVPGRFFAPMYHRELVLVMVVVILVTM